MRMCVVVFMCAICVLCVQNSHLNFLRMSLRARVCVCCLYVRACARKYLCLEVGGCGVGGLGRWRWVEVQSPIAGI